MELKITRRWQTTDFTYSEYSVAGGILRGYLKEGLGADCMTPTLGRRIPEGHYKIKTKNYQKHSSSEEALFLYSSYISEIPFTTQKNASPTRASLIITGERGALPPSEATQKIRKLITFLSEAGMEKVNITITSRFPRSIIWMRYFIKLFGPYVAEEFRSQLLAVGERLGIEPDYIMACIALETGRQFNTRAKNPGSSATGLIQFVEQTARDLGTTTHSLLGMSHIEQLAYIERYFKLKAREIGIATNKWSLEDVYYSIFNPQTIKKTLDQAIYKEGESNAYSKNRFHDRNKDGIITKREIATNIVSFYEAGQAEAG